MRKRAGIAATVLIAFALTGCSGTAPEAPEDAGATPPATTVPLAAESPAAAPSGETAYLEAVRAALPRNTQIPNATDEQLLEVGEKACAELAAGTDTTLLSVIDGEQTDEIGYYRDSQAIITAAAIDLC